VLCGGDVLDADGASVHVHATGREKLKGCWIETVFDRENPRCDVLRTVAREDRDGLLQHHRPVVVGLVDEMHGGAGPANPVVYDGPMHVHAVHAPTAKRREERRVNVDHSSSVGLDHRGRDLTQIPGKGDKRNLPPLQKIEKRFGEAVGVVARIDDRTRDAGVGRSVNRARGCSIAHAERDVGSHRAVFRGVKNRLEVASTAGGKDGDPKRIGYRGRHGRDAGRETVVDE